jgi:hypothetical protein
MKNISGVSERNIGVHRVKMSVFNRASRFLKNEWIE